MRVIKTYPGSESAIKAKQTIKELYTNRRGEQ
jgi:TolA-binding protein